MSGATKPRMCIVGVGPGNAQYLTEKARAAITASEIVLGWDLDLLPVKDLLQGKEIFVQNVTDYREKARRVAQLARETGKTVAIPRIGDPCISSGLPELLEVFSGFEVEIMPGISSVQVAASLARINIDDSVVVSFHDYGDPEAEKKFMLDAFRASKHLIILTSPDLTPDAAAKHLVSQGVSPLTPAVACSSLTLKEEEILKGNLDEISKRPFHWLSVLVVINASAPTAQESYTLWKNWRKLSGRE